MDQRQEILLKMQEDMLLFGRMIMPKMFTEESPKFHYDITKEIFDYVIVLQINQIH